MNTARQQLNVLGGGVHTVIATLNFLAFGYNALKGHKVRATFHLGVAIYEVYAVSTHVHDKEASDVETAKSTTQKL